ncbi:hypothetical protein, partial [Siminovitchia fortis]|uniref:hypothetical protein n=1 Tax=Siminovitchia fortis TaxID=254758 RepID=UPI000EE811F1
GIGKSEDRKAADISSAFSKWILKKACKGQVEWSLHAFFQPLIICLYALFNAILKDNSHNWLTQGWSAHSRKGMMPMTVAEGLMLMASFGASIVPDHVRKKQQKKKPTL